MLHYLQHKLCFDDRVGFDNLTQLRLVKNQYVAIVETNDPERMKNVYKRFLIEQLPTARIIEIQCNQHEYYGHYVIAITFYYEGVQYV